MWKITFFNTHKGGILNITEDCDNNELLSRTVGQSAEAEPSSLQQEHVSHRPTNILQEGAVAHDKDLV